MPERENYTSQVILDMKQAQTKREAKSSCLCQADCRQVSANTVASYATATAGVRESSIAGGGSGHENSNGASLARA